jgi:hypothetical protein
LPSKKSIPAEGQGRTVTPPEVHPRIKFIRSVKFAGLGLDRCEARIDRLNLSVSREEDSKLEHTIDLKIYVLEHEDDHFIVGVDFELIQKTTQADAKIVTINASFSGRFDLSEKASEENVRSFADLEAALIFFPYVRHFVSDLTYRMSIEPIVLPMTSELEKKNPA